MGNFGKDEFQRKYLWTQSKPKDDGYQSVLPFNNINMALQAEVPVNNKSISGGIKVTLYKRNDSEIHQKWKIIPIGKKMIWYPQSSVLIFFMGSYFFLF